ncbi:MAG: hypothetical protein KJN90_12380 [Gammaproteobacteria bacterium]|nr:hypothetical protein [Gammaproteobacteria bacterium]
MRFSRKVLVTLPLFVCALVLLRQGIVVATEQVPAIGRQVEVMQQQDIDPAALFYTDSRVALRAIRRAEEKVW